MSEYGVQATLTEEPLTEPKDFFSGTGLCVYLTSLLRPSEKLGTHSTSLAMTARKHKLSSHTHLSTDYPGSQTWNL